MCAHANQQTFLANKNNSQSFVANINLSLKIHIEHMCVPVANMVWTVLQHELTPMVMEDKT